MVQYHALSLLYKIKQHDRLAVSKIVQQLSKGSLRSPLATCLLIRYTSNLLHEDATATNARASYQFLENCLRHKNEMVGTINNNQATISDNSHNFKSTSPLIFTLEPIFRSFLRQQRQFAIYQVSKHQI